MGLNPDLYDAVPIQSEAATPQGAPSAAAQSSATGSFGRAAGRGLIPSGGAAIGGGLGWAGLTALGLSTDGIGLIPVIAGSLISAAGGSALANKAQDVALEKLTPTLKASMDRQSAIDAAQHPMAQTLGGVASALPAFEFAPGASVRGLSAAYRLARGIVPDAERAAAVTAARATGAQVGLGAATGVINPLLEGREPTLEDIGSGAGQALVFGRHHDYLGKIPGLGVLRHGPLTPSMEPADSHVWSATDMGPAEPLAQRINRTIGAPGALPTLAPGEQESLNTQLYRQRYAGRLEPTMNPNPVGGESMGAVPGVGITTELQEVIPKGNTIYQGNEVRYKGWKYDRPPVGQSSSTVVTDRGQLPPGEEPLGGQPTEPKPIVPKDSNGVTVIPAVGSASAQNIELTKQHNETHLTAQNQKNVTGANQAPDAISKTKGLPDRTNQNLPTWLSEEIDRQYQTAKSLGLDTRIAELSKTQTAKQVIATLGIPENADTIGMVRAVRAKLKIPAQDEAKGPSNATHPIPESERLQQERQRTAQGTALPEQQPQVGQTQGQPDRAGSGLRGGEKGVNVQRANLASGETTATPTETKGRATDVSGLPPKGTAEPPAKATGKVKPSHFAVAASGLSGKVEVRPVNEASARESVSLQDKTKVVPFPKLGKIPEWVSPKLRKAMESADKSGAGFKVDVDAEYKRLTPAQKQELAAQGWSVDQGRNNHVRIGLNTDVGPNRLRQVVQSKQSPAKASQEFDRLIAEHGMQLGWIHNPDIFYTEVGKASSTDSIKAAIAKSKAVQQSRRNAVIDMLGHEHIGEVDSAEGRAKLLEKLKQHIADRTAAKPTATGGELFGSEEMPFNLTGEHIAPAETKATRSDTSAQQEMFAIQKIVASKDPAKSADAAVLIHGSPDAAIEAIHKQLSVVDSDPATRKAFVKEQRQRLEQVMALLHERSNNPFQVAQPNIPPEQLLAHPVNRDLLAWLERLAVRYNIKLTKTGEYLTTTDGVVAAGVADFANRLAKFHGSLATVDTGLHEIAHIFLDDLRTSTNPYERAMYDELIQIFRGNEERAVQVVGVRGTDLIRNRIEGNTLARFKAWAGDFWSWVKAKWGKATPQDLANLMARRLVDGEAVARGERPPLSAQENLRYKPAAVREAEATERQRTGQLEEDLHQNDFTVPGLRGMYQAVRALGPMGEHAADALSKITDRIQHWTGAYRNQAQLAIMKLPKAQQEQLLKIFYNQRENPGAPMPTLTAEQDAAYSKIRQLLRSGAQDATQQGVLIWDGEDFRQINITNTYFPHTMSQEAARIASQEQDTPQYNALKKSFTDWVEAGGLKGPDAAVTPETAERMWKERTEGQLQKSPRQAAGFAALEKSAGLGLPPEMREHDLGRALNNYWDKFAAKMAWYEHVEAPTPENAVTRTLFNATDQFGSQTENAHTLQDGTTPIQSIAGNRKLEDAVKVLLHNFSPRDRATDAANQLIGSGIMETLTGLGDFSGGIGLSLVHLKMGDIFSLMPRAAMNLGQGIKAGMRQNRIKPNYYSQSSSIAGGGETPEVLSSMADRMRKAAGFIYKITGRQHLETWGRGYLMELGNLKTLAAKGRIEARIHDKNDVKWMNNFAGEGWEERLRSGSFTPDHIEKTAARFVDDIQGSYTGEYVPHWAISGQLAPFFSLAKWNIEMANRFTKNVINPMVRQGDFGPFLKVTLGGMAAGEVIHAVRQLITGKKSQDASWDEIAAAGGAGLPYRLMANAAYAGYSGLYCDVIKQAFDLSKGNQAQGFRFPLLGAITTTADRVKQLSVALDAGENPFEMMSVFAQTFATDNIQMARALMRFTSEDQQKMVEHANAYRDLKTFHDLNGYPATLSDSRANPFQNPLKKQFQRADIGQAVQIAPQLTQQAFERGQGDMEQTKALLNNYGSASSDLMPSLHSRPGEFMKYLNWIAMTQGPEAARQAMTGYQQKQAMDQAKRGLIPRL